MDSGNGFSNLPAHPHQAFWGIVAALFIIGFPLFFFINRDQAGSMKISNGWIYFYNQGDEGRLYKVGCDGNDLQKLTDESVHDYVIDGEWVYYTGSPVNRLEPQIDALYRVKTDGSARSMIFTYSGRLLAAKDGWIYCCEHKGGPKLYRMQTDGSHRQELGNGDVDQLICCQDRIYYIYTEYEPHHVTVVGSNADGSEAQVFFNDSVSRRLIAVDRDWLYYHQDGAGFWELWRISVDGKQTERILGTEAYGGHVGGDWVYYRTGFLGENLYRVKTDGSSSQCLGHPPGWDNIVYGDWIYFINDITGGIYRLRTDGSITEKVH